MKQSFKMRRRGMYRAAIAVFGLVALVTSVAQQFSTRAFVGGDRPGANVTRSYNPEIPNYDIRLDKASEAVEARELFRQKSGRDQRAADTDRLRTMKGIADLQRNVPDLKVEFSPDLDAPEVIGTDVLKNTFLTPPSNIKRDALVKNFVNQNQEVFGLTTSQVSELRTIADYTNPSGNLSYVDLEQRINGIPVFRGEVRAMITNQGEIARMINNIAPGLNYEAVSRNSGSAADAVMAAASYINHTPSAGDVVVTDRTADGLKVTFEKGQFADPTTAELMYFPLESGVATLAWRVLLWEPVAAYYVVVDAETGKMLWRKNLTNEQTQSATYGVYNDDSPTPLSPSSLALLLQSSVTKLPTPARTISAGLRTATTRPTVTTCRPVLTAMARTALTPQAWRRAAPIAFSISLTIRLRATPPTATTRFRARRSRTFRRAL